MSILAQHHGRCTECAAGIVPGQRIETIDDEDGWAHVDCTRLQPETAPCVCERCFSAHGLPLGPSQREGRAGVSPRVPPGGWSRSDQLPDGPTTEKKGHRPRSSRADRWHSVVP